MTSLCFRNAVPEDAERCHAIEAASYEGDEAATLAKITTRIAAYPQGFLILDVDGEIAGFINSGCAFDVDMLDEAFKELAGHDPAAPNVVILSVVVDPQYQGNGYARKLMQEFSTRMRCLNKQAIHLMCRDQHVKLYEKLGYRYVKPSESSHGGMSWHEMVASL
ncbi:MAG: GNAT family N-acetyltransferase [Pseudomonadota bacterium]